MAGVVIAGTHSGCGKTTVTLGLLAALKKKGMSVQPFKAGPDFIDAGLHKLVTGRLSINLDLWMCGEESVAQSFMTYAGDVDIAVVEGVMGMYDGDCSTARLAQFLGLPVILVVDAYGMAESAGAVVKGFVEYRSHEPESGIQYEEKNNTLVVGVIFNRVASERHFERLKAGVRDVPVLGYLPRDIDFEIPHRHLGLTVAEENPITDEKASKLADTIMKHIDINLLLDWQSKGCHSGLEPEFCCLSPAAWIPASAGMTTSLKCERAETASSDPPSFRLSAPTIAVAYDKAFCFYYPENLDMLRKAGAKIITFSLLSDTEIPAEADAVYIGGGYPELYADELSRNISMLRSVGRWAGTGRPLYAECGGLMYLSKGIHDFDGNFFEMAGVFPFKTRMRDGGAKLGYREVLLKEDCMLGKAGEAFRGHEFHYSEIVGGHADLALSSIYSVKNGSGRELQNEGYRFNNTLASYIHLHFGSNTGAAIKFINSCKKGR